MQAQERFKLSSFLRKGCKNAAISNRPVSQALALNMINEHFISEWVKNQEQSENSDCPEPHWTGDQLIELSLDGDTDELWKFVLAAYKMPISEYSMSAIAAGPLEDLLAGNGMKYIEEVELLARRDPLFKKLLAGVWQNSMSNDLWERVCMAKGISQ